jgi:hypothetical protein
MCSCALSQVRAKPGVTKLDFKVLDQIHGLAAGFIEFEIRA